MTEIATPPATRTVDARGSFCPGPLMELIREAIVEDEMDSAGDELTLVDLS